MKLNIRRFYDGQDRPVEFEWNFVDEAAARETLETILKRDSVNFMQCASLIVRCATFDGERITPEAFNQLIRGEYFYLLQFMDLMAKRLKTPFKP